MEKGDYKAFDVMRAASMIWIVGIWHFQEYLKNINILNKTTLLFTNGVLGTFFFISGFFMGGRTIISKENLKSFYYRRFIRVFPPFLFVSIAFFALHILFGLDFIESFKQLLLTITGLTMFFPPAPLTIWFISLLLFLYAITPIVICRETKVYRITSSIIIVFTILILSFLKEIDERVLLYVPIYLIGIIIRNIRTRLNTYLALLCGIALFTFGIIFDNFLYYIQLIPILGIVLLLYGIGMIISKSQIINRIAALLAYCSYMAYLFHRIYYGILERLIGEFSLVIGYLVIFPSLLVISYFLQKSYNKIVNSKMH